MKNIEYSEIYTHTEMLPNQTGDSGFPFVPRDGYVVIGFFKTFVLSNRYDYYLQTQVTIKEPAITYVCGKKVLNEPAS